MTYYNTTALRDADLRAARAQTMRQEDAVLDYFRRHPGAMFTPEQIHAAVMPDAPLTSARRAITNLTNEGALVKTTAQRRGKYGKPVHCWQLPIDHTPEQRSLFEVRS